MTYRPTDNNLNLDYHYQSTSHNHWELGQQQPNGPCVDRRCFNLPDIDWSTNSVPTHQYLTSINERYLDMIDHCRLEKTVNQQTSESTCSLLIGKAHVMPGLSDHEIVRVVSNVTAQNIRPVRRKKLPVEEGASRGNGDGVYNV